MTVTPFRRRSEWPATDREGKIIHKAQENVAHFLKMVGAELYFDAFASRLMIIMDGITSAVDDADVLKLYFEADALGLKPPKQWFVDCIVNIGNNDRRNLIRDEINALVWDGQPRLDGWLVRHAQGRDTEYDRQAFTLCCVAMVRRIQHPGTKFDQIPVLEGPQGGGKSTFLRVLARGDDYFTDALNVGATDKETLEIVHGKLIAELGELAGIGKKELNHVKAFASRQSDRARLAYGKFTTECPRQFTIWGTTNDSEYLSDPTGNRRFWPLNVGKFDLAQARKDCNQLWAEAATLEANGHPLTLPEHLWSDAAEVQKARLISDTWADAIGEKLDLFRDRAIKVRTGDTLLSIGVPLERQDRGAQMRAASIMRRLGFEPCFIGRRRLAGWRRGASGDAITLSCPGSNCNFISEGASHE